MQRSYSTPAEPDNPLTPGNFYCLSSLPNPVLEIQPDPASGPRTFPIRLPLTLRQPGRRPGEALWAVRLPDPLPGPLWAFRIRGGDDRSAHPPSGGYYRTSLRTVWLQDQQLFDYQPAPKVSPSRVIKVPDFSGRLSTRALYVYTPRGYVDHPDRHYPVLYMHDGQNIFEAFAADSFVGSWKAEKTADMLIAQGRMQECLIVGVSHGEASRRLEYTPPNIARRAEALEATPDKPIQQARQGKPLGKARLLNGQADQTFAYYRDDVAPYVVKQYRSLAGREHTAVCGSSMGGIFSLYIAWEHPEFAQHYAALSPAFAVTTDLRSGEGILERLRGRPRQDIRLWLDSGTQDSPGKGDDGRKETRAVRDALLNHGFAEGKDLRYFLDVGASHHEAAWARRLPEVFSFLFPTHGE